MMSRGGFVVRFVRRYWPALLIATAITGYTVWFYACARPDTTGVPFIVPDAGFSVRFPQPAPVPADLNYYLIADDRPDGADRREEVRLFLTTGGQIRFWSQAAGLYRFGLRVHEPPPAEVERVKRQAANLLNTPGAAGPVITNLPVLDQARTEVQGKPGRVVLVDLGDRRVLTMLFIAGGRLTFLFIEKAGADLTIDDPNAKAYFGSVEFTAK
jgi:predicted regulator of Ras-like GTPase activity (Roadblock/LC7/MglB family)